MKNQISKKDIKNVEVQFNRISSELDMFKERIFQLERKDDNEYIVYLFGHTDCLWMQFEYETRDTAKLMISKLKKVDFKPDNIFK